ncbi:Aste57867_8959 [Aphanomyces stellatus]|uniref:Aste57867_8959 protein n=1 Tax=Aphanomyces stellatus TaxID=120398 RepID=A0A485KLK1_9STRA|nr:hypothetical protein As57867_008924 [Aphanomyces stellatus]VFT85843.1 Aste57867_8959 [Aphanomyces stellatus]
MMATVNTTAVPTAMVVVTGVPSANSAVPNAMSVALVSTPSKRHTVFDCTKLSRAFHSDAIRKDFVLPKGWMAVPPERLPPPGAASSGRRSHGHGSEYSHPTSATTTVAFKGHDLSYSHDGLTYCYATCYAQGPTVAPTKATPAIMAPPANPTTTIDATVVSLVHVVAAAHASAPTVATRTAIPAAGATMFGATPTALPQATGAVAAAVAAAAKIRTTGPTVVVVALAAPKMFVKPTLVVTLSASSPRLESSHVQHKHISFSGLQQSFDSSRIQDILSTLLQDFRRQYDSLDHFLSRSLVHTVTGWALQVSMTSPIIHQRSESRRWAVDSGASKHSAFLCEWLISYEPHSSIAGAADGHPIQVVGRAI